MSLLQEALNVPIMGERTKTKFTDQHVELAVAYMNGEVAQKQVSTVLGVKSSAGLTYMIINILRYAFVKGLIKQTP